MERNNIKKTKQPNNAPNNLIINTVEVRPIERRNQDVPDWRNAMQIAESRIPRRLSLYNLYHDTILDDQVIADWNKRIDAVTLAKWKFIGDDGKEVEAVQQIIDSIGFDELLCEILNTIAWGYTMVEPKFYKNISDRWEMDTNLIPRRHMFPEKGIISKDGFSDHGINVRQGIYAKTVMEVGNTKDLGLLLPATLPVILKRGGIGDYAHFVQVFGSPIVDAVWDGYDTDQKQKLDSAIQGMGSGGVIVRPKGTELDIKENKTAGNEPHSPFLAVLNNAISHVLLGTTETSGSSNSSGYAQSKTHQDENNKRHKRDITYVRKLLNSRFIKILATHGFDTKGGKFIVEDDLKLTKKEHFEIVRDARKEFSLPTDDDWIYETFSIKKPDNYNQQKKATKEASDTQEKNTQETPLNTNETTKAPYKAEKGKESKVELSDASFFERLKSFFRYAPAVNTGATQTACCGNPHMIQLNFNSEPNYEVIIEQAWNAKGKLEWDKSLFKNTSEVLLKGFKKGFKTDFIALEYNPSFAYNVDDPAMLTAFEQNLFRFSGGKTLAQVQMLNQLFRESTSFADFKNKATQKLQVFNRQWLETEYHTAVHVGQAAATYHRLIKKAHIFPYWKYVTVGDNAVRHEHAKLEGLILPANDPRWAKIFPPNGWNCRCRIAPVMAHNFETSQLKSMQKRADTYLKGSQFAKEAAQGFGVNRATLKEVFIANQQYTRKFPGKASKALNVLKASDYDLASYSNAKKVATKDYETYTDTAEKFYKELESLNEQKILRDYNERPINITPKNYRMHTEGKKANRVPLLHALQETLLSPDETWLNGKEFKELVHLKYYNNETIVVISHIKNGKLELRTWFPLREKKHVIDKFRSGLLVYSKK